MELQLRLILWIIAKHLPVVVDMERTALEADLATGVKKA